MKLKQNNSTLYERGKVIMGFSKKVVLGIAVIIAMMGLVGCSSDNNSSTNKQSAKIEQKSKEEKEAETKKAEEEKKVAVKNANAEIIHILGDMPCETDKVEKQSWYMPWGTGAYPADSAPYWYAGKKDNRVWLRAKLVHFSSNTDWVFWDRIIFSTDKGKWEYKVKNAFAGQSGGGKDTQVVMGGKYETLDIPFEDIQSGFNQIVNGGSPIIRFQGNNRIYDYELDSKDLNHIKTGLYLYEQLKITNGKLDSNNA